MRVAVLVVLVEPVMEEGGPEVEEEVEAVDKEVEEEVEEEPVPVEEPEVEVVLTMVPVLEVREGEVVVAAPAINEFNTGGIERMDRKENMERRERREEREMEIMIHTCTTICSIRLTSKRDQCSHINKGPRA